MDFMDIRSLLRDHLYYSIQNGTPKGGRCLNLLGCARWLNFTAVTVYHYLICLMHFYISFNSKPCFRLCINGVCDCSCVLVWVEPATRFHPSGFYTNYISPLEYNYIVQSVIAQLPDILSFLNNPPFPELVMDCLSDTFWYTAPSYTPRLNLLS